MVCAKIAQATSLPTRERELKLLGDEVGVEGGGSLPTRERELKRLPGDFPSVSARSLPTRERELKPGEGDDGADRLGVAPYTGA